MTGRVGTDRLYKLLADRIIVLVTSAVWLWLAALFALWFVVGD